MIEMHGSSKEKTHRSVLFFSSESRFQAVCLEKCLYLISHCRVSPQTLSMTAACLQYAQICPSFRIPGTNVRFLGRYVNVQGGQFCYPKKTRRFEDWPNVSSPFDGLRQLIRAFYDQQVSCRHEKGVHDNCYEVLSGSLAYVG